MSKRLRKWIIGIGIVALVAAVCGVSLCEEEITDKENGVVVWHRKRIVPSFFSADRDGWHDGSKKPRFETRERKVKWTRLLDGSETETGHWQGPEGIPPPSPR